MILSSQEIKELIEKKNLISEYIDLNIQLQQCGFDLSLEKIFRFKEYGLVDFDNKERKIPDFEEILFENDMIFLPQGVYKVRFNEIVKIPANLAFILQTRSGLVRSGVTIGTALDDPGFEGKVECQLIVSNPHGLKIKKNARLLQCVFIKLSKESQKLYNGEWKNIQDKIKID